MIWDPDPLGIISQVLFWDLVIVAMSSCGHDTVVILGLPRMYTMALVLSAVSFFE